MNQLEYNSLFKTKNVENEIDKISPIQENITLLKERGLPDILNRDITTFQNRFDRLKTLRNLPANNERFEEAYRLFYYVFDVIPIMYHRLSDISIFRAARNNINEIFSTQSRISYNKDTSQIRPGKFNVYYQPMFYGCLPYEPKQPEFYPPPRLVAALECCKDLYNRESPLYVQDITIGRWHIKQPFDAINLCFDQVHLEKNHKLKIVNDEFLKHLMEAFSDEAGQFIKNIFEYFSSLCRTGSDENAYYVLSALFAAFKVYHETNTGIKVEALISTSAATDGHGLNIVMTPEAVDRCLELNAVTMDRYFLVLPEKKTYCSYPCAEIIINHQKKTNFNYQFKKYIPLADRFLRNHNLI